MDNRYNAFGARCGRYDDSTEEVLREAVSSQPAKTAERTTEDPLPVETSDEVRLRVRETTAEQDLHQPAVRW